MWCLNHTKEIGVAPLPTIGVAVMSLEKECANVLSSLQSLHTWELPVHNNSKTASAVCCCRDELVAGWVSKCQELQIPVSPSCTLRGTLASPVEVRDWVMAGLPSDGVSVDNGILVTRGRRWPLMIDPQVGTAAIKARCS